MQGVYLKKIIPAQHFIPALTLFPLSQASQDASLDTPHGVYLKLYEQFVIFTTRWHCFKMKFPKGRTKPEFQYIYKSIYIVCCVLLSSIGVSETVAWGLLMHLPGGMVTQVL